MAQGKQRRGRAARSTFKQSTLKTILSQSKGAKGSFSKMLRMEPLEDRRMLATYVVNNLGDLDNDGNVVVGSLRQAVQLSNSTPNVNDTIVFADFLFTNQSTGSSSPGAIFLDGRANGGVLNITDQVAILGPGAGVLSINGTVGQRVFNISIDADNQYRDVVIGGMTISGGALLTGDGRGGAIFTTENLLLIETEISGNSAADGGGGIYQPFGSLTVQNSLIVNNTSGGGGGGIFAGSEDGELGSLVTITNSTIAQNLTTSIVDHPGFGGGIFTRRGTVDIQHSTITENIAYRGGGVATYGRAVDEEDAPIPTTNLTHTIAYGNTRLAGQDEDLAAIYFDIEGEPLIPDLNILDYNLIGTVGGGTVAGSSPDGNFYLVISAPEGIAWTDANAIASSGTGHLATITSPEENQVVFDLIDDQLFWKLFEPETDDTRPAQNIGPWIGGIQVNEEDGPTEGWEWVQPDDQSPFVGIWDAGQPDDGAATSSEDPPELAENRLAFHAPDDTRTATWGDYVDDPEDEFKPIAFVIEYDQGTNIFGIDPELLPLDYYGGPTRTYYPNSDPNSEEFSVSPAIDAGNADFLPEQFEGVSDQRGRHFVRVADGLGLEIDRIDIGAVEVQRGVFVVDALEDENDGQYTRVWDTFPTPDALVLPNGTNVEVYDYTVAGDFSLREALEFANLNPEPSTIRFSQQLTQAGSNTDPTPSPAATILLKLGQISIDQDVTIEGPQFILEIDATGNDPTPSSNNGDGTRVFQITASVAISNLTLMGGDRQELGGGILTSGDLVLKNVTVKENSSTAFGGAIAVQAGTLFLDSTTINNNRSSSSGGGIYVISGDVTVENSTISGNTGTLHGGGIANAGGNVVIQYSTITLNTAGSTLGGGVASFRNGAATTEIRSSIIAGNTTNDVQHVLSGPSNIVSLGYNLIGNGNAVTGGVFSAAGDQVNKNPLLAPLVKLGGLTAVHRLQPGSPAIDAGDPNANGLGSVPEFDQRGFPFNRIEDVANGGRIDIGAYEVQTDVLLVGDGSPAEGSYSTFVAALTDANLNPLPETIVFLFTWEGETFPGDALNITNSVNIVGLGSTAMYFTGNSSLTVNINDGNNAELSDVRISGIRFENNTQVISKENLTFDDMLFVNNAATTNGGAISQQFGDLLIENSTFIGNSSTGTGGGGAIHVLDGNLEINNSFLSGNSTTTSAGGKGGAIYIRNGNFTADYLYITGNLTTTGMGDGGGIYARNATMTLTNSIISGNRSQGSTAEGGAISLRDSEATFIDTTFAFNITTGSQAKGGAIFMNGGSLTIERGNFFQNVTTGQFASGAAIASVNADVSVNGLDLAQNSTAGADAHGGAISIQEGSLSVVNSSLRDNHTTGVRADGGAIYSNTNLTGKQTTVLNSTISGNSTRSYGGGIYNADGLTVIKHSTITENSAPYFGFGAGVATFGSQATTRTDVGSSIIAGNKSSVVMTGNQNSDVDRVGGTFQDTFNSLGYNVIGTGLTTKFTSPGDQFGVLDPGLEILSPVLNTDGTTAWIHALKDDSPAVGRGNPAAVAGQNGVPEFDQRGENRVKQGRIDVGAYESDFTGAASGDFDGNSVINGRDFLAWQRGQSPSPGSNGDLASWQSNYGTGGGALVAALVVEEFSESVSAPLVAEETASEPSFAASEPILTGWILQAPVSTKPSATFTEAEVDVAYLAAGSELDDYIVAAADDDFGDIVTSRSLDDDSDELSAEDAVFELIGAGEL